MEFPDIHNIPTFVQSPEQIARETVSIWLTTYAHDLCIPLPLKVNFVSELDSIYGKCAGEMVWHGRGYYEVTIVYQNGFTANNYRLTLSHELRHAWQFYNNVPKTEKDCDDYSQEVLKRLPHPTGKVVDYLLKPQRDPVVKAAKDVAIDFTEHKKTQEEIILEMAVEEKVGKGIEEKAKRMSVGRTYVSILVAVAFAWAIISLFGAAGANGGLTLFVLYILLSVKQFLKQRSVHLSSTRTLAGSLTVFILLLATSITIGTFQAMWVIPTVTFVFLSLISEPIEVDALLAKIRWIELYRSGWLKIESSLARVKSMTDRQVVAFVGIVAVVVLFVGFLLTK